MVDCESSPTHPNSSKMTVLKELMFHTGNFLEAWLQLLKKWQLDGAGLGLVPGQGFGVVKCSLRAAQMTQEPVHSQPCALGDNLDSHSQPAGTDSTRA